MSAVLMTNGAHPYSISHNVKGRDGNFGHTSWALPYRFIHGIFPTTYPL